MKLYKIIVLYLILLIFTIQISYADQPLSNWYKGDQHVHTDLAIDGKVSLPLMAQAARNNNYDWLIFTDHSNGGFSYEN